MNKEDARLYVDIHTSVVKEFVAYPYCAVEIEVKVEGQTFRATGIAECSKKDKWNPGPNPLKPGPYGRSIACGRAKAKIVKLLCKQNTGCMQK